jgi:RNA polymerase sigma factor (sigma-70 family)
VGVKMSENTIENYIRSINIQQLINQLKEEDRQIILLYYWWGYRDSEIGQILGLSQQIINYRRNKSIKQLKEKILYPDIH